jgi:AcrR family transcriptional regulator
MGSRERRRRERADTRQRILAAARDLLVRRGYEATTMRLIADRVEYTATAIYHHFRNKEALLAELCAVDFRSLAGAFQRIGRVEDVLERLAKIGEAYVEFGLTHPNHYQLMFMTPRPALTPDSVTIARGDPAEDAYAFLRQTCEEAIVAGRLRSEFDNPDEVALILWASLHGLVALHIARTHDERVQELDIRATAKRLSASLLRGLVRESA